MQEEFKVAAIQTSLAWEDVDANLNHFQEKINGIDSQVDLIILPEMFSTGFSIYPSKYLPQNHQVKVESFLKKNSIGRAICGSIIYKDKDSYRNRFLFAADGEITHHYDKKHLFSMGEEYKEFSAGSDKLVFDYKGWKICANICYDLRFPVWIRNNKDNPYDLLIFVANWPQKRAYAWKTLLQARAIENQAYTIGVNITGNDGNDIPYSGDSMLLHPDGNILSDAQSQDTILIETFTRDEITKTRRYLPFLKDMDGFKLL